MSQMLVSDSDAFKGAMGYEQLNIFIPIQIGKNPTEAG